MPRKNLLPYRGKPLLTWAIEAAKGSRYLDQITLSTDDEEIFNSCLESGINVLRRPAHLATDDASCEDVIRHVLRVHDYANFAWVVLLQPTSPNRTAADIDACIERAQLGHGCISTFHGKTNGAVYVATTAWLAEHDFSHMGLAKHEMPEERSLDINFPEDFDK